MWLIVRDYSKNPDQLMAGSKGALKHLYRHAQSLLAIERVIKSVVKGPVQVAKFEKDELALITPSAALATRIKYSQNTLIAELSRQKKPISVKSITVDVRPNLVSVYQPKAPSFIAKPPSEQRGQELIEAAKYIEDDALSKALIRLAESATVKKNE